MVTDTTNTLEQLLPVKHDQRDLFLCDVADAVFKDLIPQLEHPFYSLSKKPETAIRRYEHNGNWLEITPSVKGLATIYDKDILIYCISQLMEKLKRGEPVGQRLRINSRDLLVFTNRGTTGPEYNALCEAIDRLAEEHNFPSRQPRKAAAAPARKRRVYRTGRNRNFSVMRRARLSNASTRWPMNAR